MPILNSATDTTEFPVWDATTLTRLMGDNLALRHRMLEKFLVKAQEQVTTILHASATGNTVTVGSVAHSLKSSSRTVGAMQFAELCMAMERAGKAGDASTCKVLAERLSGSFAAAAEKIKQSLR